MLNHDNTITTPSKSRSAFNMQKYKFMLEAPFEISGKCCDIMKKKPAKEYSKKTGRVAITGQMASESKLRTQVYLKNGCNSFSSTKPISNPMGFWTEQDILLYIYINKLPIASIYGEVVIDGDFENQISLADFGLFDTPLLKTTGVSRTGCMFCGFGCHLEKESRFKKMKESHPKQYEYIMEKLKYKEIIDWLNEHGNLNIKY